MARNKVHFYGQPVAAVAASTIFQAEMALALIKIEYEPLVPVLDINEAIKENSPRLHDEMVTVRNDGSTVYTKDTNVAQYIELDVGDTNKGFAEADVVVDCSFETQIVHQGYIEPESETGLVNSNGEITIWAPTQGTFLHQEELAALMDVPIEKITVLPLEIGGGFGGKEHIRISPLCVALSQKCGLPVQITLTREEVLIGTGPGAATVSSIKIGAKKNGAITSLFAKFMYSGGCYPGGPIQRATWCSLMPYQIPNFKLTGFDVVTNKPKTVPYRAPGGAAATFAIESSIDELAQKLNMDPLKIRKINVSREGDLAINGTIFGPIGFEHILDKIESHPAWTSSLGNENRARGLALGYWPSSSGESNCKIKLNVDGSVNLLVGSVDLSSTRTGLAQIVAEELQISINKIQVITGDTSIIGFTQASAGSRISHDMGTAVYLACKDLLSQLKQKCVNKLGGNIGNIEYSQGIFRRKDDFSNSITLQKLSTYIISNAVEVIGYGFVSELELAPASAGHVVDIEIDTDTGKVNILNYTSFQDVGFTLNPDMVEGQMQGGAVQGIGWALSEEYIYDSNGVMKNPTLLDYRIPTALDVPMLMCDILNVPAKSGPYGVRGAGEMGIVLPPACIANAISRVLMVRPYRLPMNPERVFWLNRCKK